MLVFMFAAWSRSAGCVLNRTTFGRRTYAVGGNPEAARLAGIDVKPAHRVAVRAVGSVLRHRRGDDHRPAPTPARQHHGDLYELDAIAAVVIGGTLLSGGRGTIVGTIIGVLIFSILNNVFTLNNLDTDPAHRQGRHHRHRRPHPGPRPALLGRPLTPTKELTMPEPLDVTRGLRRRGFLAGALGVGATAALAACTSNEPPSSGATVATPEAGGEQSPELNQ